MSVGTVTGGDQARPVGVAAATARWLAEQGLADAGERVASGFDLESVDVARVVVGAGVVPADDVRAPIVAQQKVEEFAHWQGPLDPPVPGETQEQTDRRVGAYYDEAVAFVTRATRQQLGVWRAPVRRRPPLARPVALSGDHSRERRSGQRRGRRGALVRAGPGRERPRESDEGDPDDVTDIGVAVILLVLGLSEPKPDPPRGERIAFESFRPGWPSAVRSILFGLLPDSVQAAYWHDLRLHLEAA